MSLDLAALKREYEKLGVRTIDELSVAVGIDRAAIYRCIRPGGVPNVWLLRWLVSNNVDIRCVWRLDE